jgi:putative PIN family toxin of toxin-antitoxin system
MVGAGVPAQILAAWRRGLFELVISEPVLAEYARVFGYPRVRSRLTFPPQALDEILNGFREGADVVVPGNVRSWVRADPDDDAFLQCAIAGAADFVVSGDKHLRDLDTVEGIQIITATVFLALLQQVR